MDLHEERLRLEKADELLDLIELAYSRLETHKENYRRFFEMPKIAAKCEHDFDITKRAISRLENRYRRIYR
ncbi:hypothetical protein SAMN05443429_11262 [Cruoricaptor ignavus]|uniref:Uncharacterized protein n=1 Tax=Cruoricaptor ignavus TaxID=1118202 RepID=A0A1M6HHA4_9FLAO|nr:hypothetical protein [Cruoricaptor ignavus]SHJ21590.1 hypothetical protein SAMN05443429_11262 [Cruoricaptor ignavus]